jgi:hypothetical protein
VQEEEGEEARGRGGLQEEEEAVKAALALTAATAALVAAPVAGATTYNNDTPIFIPDDGIANPYPSSITVAGTAPPITDINVGFDGFTHEEPPDVSFVLVGPNGQALNLIGCIGANNFPASAAFITLTDGAAQLPNNGSVNTGTFRPTSHCPAPRVFPAPGPLTAYHTPGPSGPATFASTFNGTSPIGTWNLFVVDTSEDNRGSIPGGWSLDVNPDVTPLPAVSQTSTPTFTPAPTKKKCKRRAKGKKGVAAAAKCKKKKKGGK